MKKQIKRLSLSKKTISNLNAEEMNRRLGAGTVNGKCEYTKAHTCRLSCGGTRCE